MLWQASTWDCLQGERPCQGASPGRHIYQYQAVALWGPPAVRAMCCALKAQNGSTTCTASKDCCNVHPHAGSSPCGEYRCRGAQQLQDIRQPGQQGQLTLDHVSRIDRLGVLKVSKASKGLQALKDQASPQACP